MEETDISLRSIFGLLRRQVRLIVVTAVAIFSLAAVWVFSQTPIYTASTLLMVDPSQKNLIEPDQASMAYPTLDNGRIDSEVEIMRSDNILLDVIRRLDLVESDEFGVSISLRQQLMSLLRLGNAQLPTGERALNQVLANLKGSVTVQRKDLTYLISLQVRSANAARAAELANAIADSYIANQIASKVEAARTARDILQKSIEVSRQAIVDSEGSFDNFIQSNLDQIVNDTGRTDIAQMQREIEALKQARQQTTTTVDLAQQQLAQGDYASLVASLQDDALNALVKRRDELNARIANADQANPATVDLRAELQRLDQSLKTTAGESVAALRQQVTEQQSQETGLRESLRSAVVGSNLSADSLTQIYELQQNAAVARSQYESLLARVQTLDTQTNLQVADTRIVSPALPPSGPSFPSITSTMFVAGLIALALGVALAFLYENYLGGFTTPEQVESVLRLPVAATTPKARARGDQRTVADLTVSAPLSIIAEATRRVRANIEQIIRQRQVERRKATGGQPIADEAYVVMVTSSVPNEGKTTLALSLARSYALSGRSTLLIDCDLRKPSIHRQLGLEPSRGFVDFLTGDDERGIDIRDVVVTDPSSPVTVILGARRSSLPTDQLIGSHAFERLIESAKRTFSVIVVDTPPLGAVVDGLYVAPYADVVAFAIRWSSTPQSEVKAAVAALRASKGENTAVVTVLCQQDLSQRSYSSKYGEYYTDSAG